jgi:hypothetical protein
MLHCCRWRRGARDQPLRVLTAILPKSAGGGASPYPYSFAPAGLMVWLINSKFSIHSRVDIRLIATTDRDPRAVQRARDPRPPIPANVPNSPTPSKRVHTNRSDRVEARVILRPRSPVQPLQTVRWALPKGLRSAAAASMTPHNQGPFLLNLTHTTASLPGFAVLTEPHQTAGPPIVGEATFSLQLGQVIERT